MSDFAAAPNWANLMPANVEPRSKENATMDIYDSELLAKASRLIDERRFDEASGALEQIEKRLKHRVTVTSHDDGKDERDAQLDDLDPDDEEDSSDSSSDDDEEDDEPGPSSAGYKKALDAPSWSAGRPPSGRAAMFADNQRRSVYPATGVPRRTKFDSRVEFVQQRDNCSRTQAMSRARQEFPESYMDAQRWGQTTSQQQAARGGTNQYAKGAPSYEDLLGQELVVCGGNEVLAKQRLQTRWGNNLPASVIINKGTDLVDQFQDEVYKVCERDDVGLLEATEIAARENPRLMKFMR